MRRGLFFTERNEATMIRYTMVLGLALPLALIACKGDDAGNAPGAAGCRPGP